MSLVEQISLPNDIMVEAWDKSIPIAADTTRVKLLIRINVELQPSYFIKSEHFELVRKILGPEIFFEYIKGDPLYTIKKKAQFSKNC